MRYTLVSLIFAAPLQICLAQEAAAQYYIVGRYYCVDVDSGDDRASCDITTDSPQSCQEALQAQQSAINNAGGDPCRKCANIIDRSKRWNGLHDLIQGGPCQSYGN